MEDDFFGLPIKVKGEDGKHYLIEPFEATIESVDYLWEIAGRYSFLFSELDQDDKELFKQSILSPGVVILTVSELKDAKFKAVGVMMADRIKPEKSARVHYLFWDKVQKGRQRVLFAGMKWLVDEFLLRRLSAEIMQYAYAALRRAHKMGFLLEGRIREGILYQNKWADVMQFGVLASELTPEAIENGKIERTQEEASWYGLLDDNYALARAITKER